MLRDDVSKILGIRVEPGQYKQAFKRLDTMGGLHIKRQIELILLVLEYLDKKEEESRAKTPVQPAE